MAAALILPAAHVLAQPPAPEPAPADAMAFDIADASKWRVTCDGPTKLELRVEQGVLHLRWPGGPGTAVVEYNDAADIASLRREDYVRYVCFLNILESEYGHELSVQLRPLEQSGRALSPYFMRQPTYASGGIYTSSDPQPMAAPGQWARVDFNYRAPATVAKVRPRFVLQGNAVTVAVAQAYAVPGLVWTRGRAAPQPEPREFDAPQVASRLAARPRAVPKLEIRGGRTALVVNGQDVLPASYHRGLYYPHYARYGEFTRAGHQVFHIPARLGPLSPTHRAGVGNLWRGKDTFDFQDLEKELTVLAGINPDALVVLVVGVMPYNDWAGEHPDDIVANAKGEKLVTSGGEGTRYGGEPDYTQAREEGFAPCLYGGQFPIDAAAALRRLAEFLETSPVGKMVFEVDMVGGNDGQFFPWDRDHGRGEDHSPAAQKAWRQFLRERYGNDAAKLRAVWGDDAVDFDAAPIASLEQRGYGKQPPTRQGIDYNDHISDATANLLITMARGIKQGSGGRLLAGTYYPDSGQNRIISRHALEKILAAPEIDAMRSVIWRQMNGSAHWHNKLHWCELDLRPPFPNPILPYTHGLHYPESYFQTMVWRYASRAVTDQAGGYYLFDMAEGWYQDPAMIDFFGQVRRGLAEAINDQVNIAPVVGVFTDERAPFRMHPDGNSRLCNTSAMGVNTACDRSGVPYRRYLLTDLLKADFPMPAVCILRMPMAMTPAEARIIQDKARRAGATLVWGYGPGGVADGKPSVQDVCGFDAQLSPATVNRPIVIDPKQSPAPALADRILGAPPVLIGYSDANRWRGECYVIKPQPGDQVIGHYAGTDLPAVVRRQEEGLTQWIIGRPGALSPELVRHWARQAGFQPLSDTDDELWLGSGILTMYTDRGGPRTIRLPRNITVTTSPTGHAFTVTDEGFTFTADYGRTAVFGLTRR